MDFDEICKKIKELKIQGAENVARNGIKAFMQRSDNASVKKLLGLRATEPLLKNAIMFSRKDPTRLGKIALKHFDDAEEKIAKIGSKIIKNTSIVYTHCHSSTVVNLLKEAKKTKKFEVYNTETRPLYQGRITARELNAAGISVTHFIDSSAEHAISKADIMMIGADAITKTHIINKVGSGMFARIAKMNKVPIYVCADSWKYDSKETIIEERHPHEVWKDHPERVIVKNYAFEAIEMKYVDKIISEIGIYTPRDFIKAVKIAYPWIQGRGDRGIHS